MQTANNAKLIKKLVLSVFAMFAFGFALVPLYDTFCEITGINGRIVVKALPSDVDRLTDNTEQRKIKIQFMVKTQEQGRFEFITEQKQMVLTLGELNEANFSIRNMTNEMQYVQAIPSVSPGLGSLYLNKTECFCFNQQQLHANEKVVYPMRFFIDPDLPEDISLLTVSYTLYQVPTDKVAIAAPANIKGRS